ncbi:autotransporter outer membrane beta-barrel domain-containing protein (plasmid) [Achromobacter xylosoxidans]|uniref:autotransporter family protein n=1 Tax=Alcaligenes xylosoxydans xylosoxydans TaxID=85698 RepID=UPI000DD188EE|nr:autotransporter serine protease [Achromobacter xylosoxidans]AXA80632.1 autotransporter outer membrane beta-barrel domain-containing protein [Achromobacter xylosoxidans]
MSTHKSRQLTTKLALSVLTLAILSACGGGGGGGGGGNGGGGGSLPGTGGDGTGGTPGAGWNPTSPQPSAPTAANFDGSGVKVGVVDTGFDADPMSDHPAAVAAALQEVISPALAEAGTHGAIVSRVVGGKDLGDGFPKGMASGFSLYQANHPSMFSAATLSTNFSALASRGVKIINNSWSFSTDPQYALPGGAQTAPGSTTAQNFLPVFRDAVLRDGQLLVWANGNEGQANPFFAAGAPYIDPALERGWLTVTQLQADGTLAPWSNACGVAANWCVSAKAPAGLTGTSFAAPVVTATAALVSQAFPWMDNSALRQTVLSTADDLGDRAKFGWGQVNPDRAVRGPAKFDTALTLGGDFVANFNTYRSHFYNDISGNTGLTKDGTGSLVLWGKNTYAGPTTINKGAVELYGSVTSDVNVFVDGKLISDGGTVAASVNNSGAVQASGKGLQIKGNYNAWRPQATLMTQLGTTVTVDGVATLNGSNLVVTKPDDAYVVKAKETALKAGQVSGQFGSVTGGPGLLYSVSATYTPTQVDLDVARSNVASVAQGLYSGQTSRLAAAQAVETAFQAADAQVQGESANVSADFITVAAKLQAVDSSAGLATALDSVSGQIYASSQALTFQQSQAVNRALSDRVDNLSIPGAATGAWVNMIGGSGKLEQSGFAGADTRDFGGQVGFDHRVSENGILGAALTWSDAKADFDSYGGKSKSQGTGLSLYGRYGADAGTYLSGRVGYEWIHSNVKRDILVDGADHVNSGRTDRITALYAELGHAFIFNGGRITPFAGISYDHLKRGAIDESDSAFGLKADKKSFDQAAGLLGLRMQSSPIEWAGGVTTVTGYGAYRYGNPTDLDFTAAFAGAPDATFKVKGIGLQRHTGWLGLGAASQLGADLTWFINYDLQLGRGGVNNNVFSAGLRYSFN